MAGTMRNSPSGIAAILLAAGAGSRFGGGKLLAEFRGKPLISATLDGLLGAPVDEVIPVVGSGARELRSICEAHGARVVENPDWQRGQSTSVRAGLKACGPGTRAAVILLADQPLVGAGAVERLAEAFERGARIAVATYGGKRRNPVLFSREVWPLLLSELSGDEGARGIMRAHSKLVTEVPCDDVANPADVDTVEDLRRLDEISRKI